MLTIPCKSLPDWALQLQCGGASLQGTLLTYSTGQFSHRQASHCTLVQQQPTKQDIAGTCCLQSGQEGSPASMPRSDHVSD